MSREDYAHWNEDQDYMWWQEEGRHSANEEPEYDPNDFLPDYEDDSNWEDDEAEDE